MSRVNQVVYIVLVGIYVLNVIIHTNGEQHVNICAPIVQVAVNPMVVPLAILATIGDTTYPMEAIIVMYVWIDAHLVPVTLIVGHVVKQATGEMRVRTLVTTVQIAANQMDAYHLVAILDTIGITAMPKEDTYVADVTILVQLVPHTKSVNHATQNTGELVVRIHVPIHVQYVHQIQNVRAVT